MRPRQTLRRLLRSGPTSVVVVVSLAVGVGAVASVWTTAETVLWAPLPLPEPDRLVALRETDAAGRPGGVALENLLDFERSESVTSMAAYRPRSFGLRRPSENTRVVQVGQVTEAFFRTLGVAPVEGRGFEGADEQGVIVVSPGVGRLGDVLLLNEEPRTVVGVLPPSFRFPMARGILPVAFIPLSHADYGGKRSVRTLEAVARLAESTTLEDARSELETIAARLGASFPETNADFGISVVELHEALTSRNVTPVRLLGAVVLALILIVTVNLMNVFLARRASRASELALRRTLGARLSDLFAMLFTENAWLGLTGAALGLLLASRLLELVPTLIDHLGGGPVEPPELGLDAVLLAFGLGIASAAVFALPFETRPRSRGWIIVAQVALGMLLVQATVLLGRSFLRLAAVDPGFRTERVLTFGLGLPEAVYDTSDDLLDFHRRLLAELESIPGVSSAGTAAGGLLAGRIRHNVSFRPEGASRPRRDWPSVSARVATPGYFESLGVPLLRGRALLWTDDDQHPKVVLVNRSFEETYMKEGALGRRLELSWAKGELFEIVGVVADTRQIDLATEAAPEIVMSMSQMPTEYGIYTLRVDSKDPALFSAVRDTVSRLDGRLETVRVREAEEWVASSLASERLSLTLVAVASTSALALASLGIHGLVLAMVLGRRREMAIRLALGAGSASVERLVLREGLKLVAIGTILGATAFAFLTPWLRSRLHGVEPFDPASTIVTLALLVVIAALSCAAPARRAARTPMADALRGE